ncbi:restriction endonuclease subunit S [Paenibacillus whitsoniae]|uniref:Restriction endonuclease subunit S n=1 Tax=Paenibacillus whitsoniae TaxID=2496558 RepID=A0A430J4P3_9BACL|nr:restriction endonuclease subunit S [Paenibacillus whitsoniae]RTE02096.1 restriction endonuclease subunit S [Paenibacillus whitsoniae]
MSREELFMQMLEATARVQEEIALMLEARVVEARKAQNWVLLHLTSENLEGHEHKMKQTADYHSGIIDLIDSLTKMEAALNHQLTALLGKNEGGSGFGFSSGLEGGMLGDSFLSLGEDDKS